MGDIDKVVKRAVGFNIVIIIASVMVSFFGLFVMLFGGMKFISESHLAEFKKTATLTDAVITNIESYTTYSNGDSEIWHDVYVEFTVRGETYSGKLKYYDSFMNVGDLVGIYYNDDDPSDFRADINSDYWSSIPLSIGSIIVISGIISIICQFMKMRSKNKLILNSRIVTAKFQKIEYKSKRGYPSVIYCQYQENGEIYTFKSDKLYLSIEHSNNIRSGKYDEADIEVYVSPDNFKKYYVDIDSIQIPSNEKWQSIKEM